jgi:hypothetical protein
MSKVLSSRDHPNQQIQNGSLNMHYLIFVIISFGDIGTAVGLKVLSIDCHHPMHFTPDAALTSKRRTPVVINPSNPVQCQRAFIDTSSNSPPSPVLQCLPTPGPCILVLKPNTQVTMIATSATSFPFLPFHHSHLCLSETLSVSGHQCSPARNDSHSPTCHDLI